MYSPFMDSEVQSLGIEKVRFQHLDQIVDNDGRIIWNIKNFLRMEAEHSLQKRLHHLQIVKGMVSTENRIGLL